MSTPTPALLPAGPEDARPPVDRHGRLSGAGELAVHALHATALLLAAFLLFAIQPMVGKAYLPILGGAPAVWTTCLAFFQTMLLAGYAYAHAGSALLGPRRVAVLHVGLALLVLVAATGAVLPVDVAPPAAEEEPRTWLFVALLTTIGAPFVLVAATAPMLQRWYAAGDFVRSGDPYHLYAASNLGSLAALVAYPAVIEPAVGLARQAQLWRFGLGGLVVLQVGCAVLLWRSPRLSGSSLTAGVGAGRADRLPPWRWLRWVALAFVPSSLLLGVTAYLSTDLAAVPMLWVIPLALYLISLIATFARRPFPPHSWNARLLPLAAMVLAPALAAGLVQPFWIPVHLAAFVLAALVCHGELVRDRPAVGHLTAFYLAMAVGGAAGGLFNAIVAPMVFDRIAEYPIALVLALLAVPRSSPAGDLSRRRWRWDDLWLPAIVFVLTAALVRDISGIASTAVGVIAVMAAAGLVLLACVSFRSRPRRFAMTIGAVLLGCGLSEGVDGRTLARERDFFGVLRVTSDEESGLRRLFHGSTLHGQQSTLPGRTAIPLSYFHPTGPIGQVFEAFQARRRPGAEVAVVGLGVGSLAAYARPAERWTFFEIDPAVVRVANDPELFTYLRDSAAREVVHVLGDARLRLSEAPDGHFDLIILDAFSSDALPVHLMTREALRLYRRKLAPGGVLAFNLSNRYLDLDPVLGALAADAGLVCRVRHEVRVSPEQRAAGKLPSIWGVVALRAADLGPIADDPRWQPARQRPGDPVWTDAWSSLLRAWRRGKLVGEDGPAANPPHDEEGFTTETRRARRRQDGGKM